MHQWRLLIEEEDAQELIEGSANIRRGCSDHNNYTISAILRIGDLTGENY
ncbi:MAG: hypothetical protein H8E17_01685 [Deltaproteobacteria bacterium]|nr:hypothetical protein [Deltaproteobacteria bacterium]